MSAPKIFVKPGSIHILSSIIRNESSPNIELVYKRRTIQERLRDSTQNRACLF